MAVFHLHEMLNHYPFSLPAPNALPWARIREEVAETARFATQNLQTLLFTGEHPRDDSNVMATTDIVTQRHMAIAEQLHAYATGDIFEMPENPNTLDQHILDFRTYLGIAAIAAEFYGECDYTYLRRLVAVVMVRYKIERHLCQQNDIDSGAFVGSYDLPAASPENIDLSPEEVAVAAGMKVQSVRNTLTSKELTKLPSGEIPINEAIHWISRKQGFCWPVTCMHIDDTLFLSGKLANQWLEDMTSLERGYQDPQRIVTSWRVPRSNLHVVVNANGMRKCVLSLPFEPDEALLALGLTDERDQSRKPKSPVYDRAFPGGRPTQLWQVTVPTLRVLKAVIEALCQRGLKSA